MLHTFLYSIRITRFNIITKLKNVLIISTKPIQTINHVYRAKLTEI